MPSAINDIERLYWQKTSVASGSYVVFNHMVTSVMQQSLVFTSLELGSKGMLIKWGLENGDQYFMHVNAEADFPYSLQTPPRARWIPRSRRRTLHLQNCIISTQLQSRTVNFYYFLSAKQQPIEWWSSFRLFSSPYTLCCLHFPPWAPFSPAV